MHCVRGEVQQSARPAQLLGLIGNLDAQRALHDVVPLLIWMQVRTRASAFFFADESALHALAFNHWPERGRVTNASVHARHLSQLEYVVAVTGFDRTFVLGIVFGYLHCAHVALLMRKRRP